MLTAVVVGGLLGAGVPVGVVVAVWLAVIRPVWFLVAVAGWAAWHQRARFRARGASADAEAAVLRAVAAELSAGASLRGSLSAAAGTSESVDMSRVARLAEAGRPMDEVADAVEEALSVNGRRAAAALHLAGRTGAAPRGVLERLAAQAADLGALARERRVLTAQARMSAALVGGAPVALVAVLGITGRLSGLFGDPIGRVVFATGAALLLAGMAAVAIMLARANR
jgi:Flp pilus assembly protein TadB